MTSGGTAPFLTSFTFLSLRADFNWSSLNYAFNGATVYSMGEAQCTFNSPLCGITNTNRSAPFLTCSRYDFNPGTMKIQCVRTRCTLCEMRSDAASSVFLPFN